MNYCPHCMQPAEGTVCPHCGGSLSYTAQPTQLPAGTVLTGTLHSYQVGAALGQGGFGVTYIALELERQIRVAIKEYFPVRCAWRTTGHGVVAKSGSEAEFRKGYDNFCKEARRLAAIKPLPSIVRVIDCFMTNGTAYIVMEYLDGIPLHRVAQEMGGRIPADQLLEKLPPLMDDIEQLHQQEVLHRDITPDNLLWMSDGTLKLIDFGSARSMGDDRPMTVMLKRDFAPVEQNLTHGQGPWTDVYGLAATIYYVLTGKLPPSAPDRLEQDTIRLPSELGVEIDPQSEQALMHGLAVQPKDRYQSIAEFKAALFPYAGYTGGTENTVYTGSEGGTSYTDGTAGTSYMGTPTGTAYAGAQGGTAYAGGTSYTGGAADSPYYNNNGTGNRPYNPNPRKKWVTPLIIVVIVIVVLIWIIALGMLFF